MPNIQLEAKTNRCVMLTVFVVANDQLHHWLFCYCYWSYLLNIIWNLSQNTDFFLCICIQQNGGYSNWQISNLLKHLKFKCCQIWIQTSSDPYRHYKNVRVYQNQSLQDKGTPKLEPKQDTQTCFFVPVILPNDFDIQTWPTYSEDVPA